MTMNETPSTCTHHAKLNTIRAGRRRSDGTFVYVAHCASCNTPIRSVVPFGTSDNDPIRWHAYDPGDTTPDDQIAPLPEPGVITAGADFLENEKHRGILFRLGSRDTWHTLADVAPMGEDCHITLTGTDGYVATVWATRLVQLSGARFVHGVLTRVTAETPPSEANHS